AETVARFPDLLRTTVTINGEAESIIRVLNRDKAWQHADGKTRELKDDDLVEIQAATHQTHLCTLVPMLKDRACTLLPVGEAKVHDRPALGIRVSVKGRPDVHLYFDKVTAMLAKAERRAQGLNQQEV